jgi:hypothetical protein
MTYCSLVGVYKRFGETYRFHLQARRLSLVSKRKRKVTKILPDYTMSHPIREYNCDNLKAYVYTVCLAMMSLPQSMYHRGCNIE